MPGPGAVTAPPAAGAFDDPEPVVGVAVPAIIGVAPTEPPAPDEAIEAPAAWGIGDPTPPEDEPAGAMPVDEVVDVAGGTIV